MATAVLLLTSSGVLADNGNGNPQDIDDSNLDPSAHAFGNPHEPHVGARTVDYWTGNATAGGQDYAYRMVGGDPAAGAADTVTVDVVPVDLNVRGMWFHGTDAVDPVLGSPLFQASDYSAAVHATHLTSMGFSMGTGGNLSAGNDGAQLVDATMRAQFNAVGTDYHLNLEPAVRKTVALAVPAGHGLLARSRGGVVFAIVDPAWMQSTIEGLTASLHWLEPHRLALFLTDNVVLGTSPTSVLFGAHGVTDVTAEGNGSDGRQALQTYVWSSWFTAGLFRLDTTWAIQDIYGLSHELVEWASNPFLTNTVPVWKSPMAPQYGCSTELETADPLARWGFSFGANNVIDPADPSYSPTKPHGNGDGNYHASDQALLPWFFRMSPNTVSQPSQTSNNGRYAFMGDLSFFHQPATATGC